ncbi:hypothetical protein ACHAXA_010079 [Cyclostephanos tholiformis]|uniref:Uncharacterized protein n=1 Tax=Cyclostephanos tholiformis TaxID=382380 RepID=A0ABD3R754_9STRA
MTNDVDVVDDDDARWILESPSAERNKGPIYDVVLGPLVFPRLIEDARSRALRVTGNDDDDEGWRGGGGGDDVVIRVLELAAGCGVHTVHFASSFLASTSSTSTSTDDDDHDVGLEWHPSDPDPEARLSIDARVRLAGLTGRNIVVLPSNTWTLGLAGGTALGDGGHRDRDGDGGAGRVGGGGGAVDASGGGGIGREEGGDGDPGRDYDDRASYFDLVLCINMIHIAPWEATLGLMECAGTVLRRGGLMVTYGPYKVGGDAVESNLNFDKSLRAKNPEWGVRDIEDVVNAAEKRGMELYQTVEMPSNNLCVLFRKK